MPDHREKKERREKKESETTFESVFSLGHVRFACRVLIWVHGSYRSILLVKGEKRVWARIGRYKRLTLVLTERT